MLTEEEVQRILNKCEIESTDWFPLDANQLYELNEIIDTDDPCVVTQIRAAISLYREKYLILHEQRTIAEENRELRVFESSLIEATKNRENLSQFNQQALSLAYNDEYQDLEEVFESIAIVKDAVSEVRSLLSKPGRPYDLILRGLALEIAKVFAWNYLPIKKHANSKYLRCVALANNVLREKYKGKDAGKYIDAENVKRVVYSVIDYVRENDYESSIRSYRIAAEVLAVDIIEDAICSRANHS